MQKPSMPTGSVVEPASQQQFAPATPGAAPLNTGAPLMSAAGSMAAPPAEKKSHGTLVSTIMLIVVSLIAIVFIFLFIQKYIEWDAISTDIDGQVNKAVAVAVAENTSKLEAEFEEREKFPYEEFTGPEDYGRFSFQYPKTWSVYVAKDAAKGGDFEAYFNPKEVQPVSNTTINALRLRIRDATFDTVVRTYESALKSGKLNLKTDTVGGVLANIYTGEISNNIRGAVMVLKLRDKTVILQTDSENFLDAFYGILKSVSLVE